MRLLLVLLLLVGQSARVARAQCDPKTSAGMGPEGFCTCKNGFLGPACTVCSDDRGCQIVMGNKEAGCSSTTYAPDREMHGWCTVERADIPTRMIPQQPYVEFTYTNPTGFSFEIFAEKATTFRCEATQASIEKDGGTNRIRIKAPDLSCSVTCGAKCSEGLPKGAIARIGKKGDTWVMCDPEKGTCIIHEDMLSLIAPTGVHVTNCMVSECLGPKDAARIAVTYWDSTPPPIPVSKGASTWLGVSMLAVLALITATSLAACARLGGRLNTYKGAMSRLSPGGGPVVAAGKKGGFHTRTEFTVVWDDLSYQVKGRPILSGVSGAALPGQILALMGSSGAGKSTLLDMLALKAKSGKVGGRLLYNGKAATPNSQQLKKVVGFVDQEDNLKGTLTVYESVLFSACLRLPRGTPLVQRAARTIEVLKELRIDHVADHAIGFRGRRGVSGGEKRRVSVAMELVNQPAVLFLDEPTSGLDSYNARLLVDCLCDLSTAYGTTVITSIHQPSSSVFSAMDRVLVLSHGEAAYHGTTEGLVPFLASCNYHMPVGHNPADFVIDVISDSAAAKEYGVAPSKIESKDSDPEDPSFVSSASFVRPSLKSFKSLSSVEFSSAIGHSLPPISGKVATPMIEQYRRSEAGQEAREEIDRLLAASPSNDGSNHYSTNGISNGGSRSADPCSLPKRLAQATERWLWEVGVLSRRSALDLIRNPFLLLSHLGAMTYFGLLMGVIYFQLGTDGFESVQDRVGGFLLSCLFLTFTGISALPLFWLEKDLYIHERSNRFYSRSAYFVVKVLLDLLPLRLVPTVLYGVITHEMIGLKLGTRAYVNYLIFLVLVACVAAVLNLIMGMLSSNIMSGILVAVLAMVHFFMLTTLFVNFDAMKLQFLSFLEKVSFFNYALSGLSINELQHFVIHKFAISSGEGILSKFNITVTDRALYDDMLSLLIYLCVSLALAYLVLATYIREKR